MYKLSDDKRIARRQRIERAIVRRVVKDALAAGYVLSVDDGGDELAVEEATKTKPVMDALLNTDDDTLILRRNDERGWVRFVYGNSGWDVINDYTTNLEDVLAWANRMAERLQVRTLCNCPKCAKEREEKSRKLRTT